MYEEFKKVLLFTISNINNSVCKNLNTVEDVEMFFNLNYDNLSNETLNYQYFHKKRFLFWLMQQNNNKIQSIIISFFPHAL